MLPTEFLYSKCVPWRAVIELTNFCYFNCVHCYHNNHKKCRQELSKSEIFQIIDELYNLSCFQITLSGGEATAHPDLDEIILYAINKGISVQLLSNGFNIKEALKSFDKYSSLFKVDISLMGNEKKHNLITNSNSFDTVIESILFLKACGVKVSINTVIMQQNFDDIDFLNDFAKKYQIPWNHTIYIYGDNEYKFRLTDIQIEEYFKKFPAELNFAKTCKNCSQDETCNVGRTSLHIDCTGNVYPCSWYKLCIGSVRSNSLKDIWTSNLILDRVRETKLFSKQCLQCEFNAFCKKCPGYALIESGSDLPPKEYCRISKIKGTLLKYYG